MKRARKLFFLNVHISLCTHTLSLSLSPQAAGADEGLMLDPHGFVAPKPCRDERESEESHLILSTRARER